VFKVWSVGCVIIEMMTGSHPWVGNCSLTDLITEMKKLHYPPEIPKFASKLC